MSVLCFSRTAATAIYTLSLHDALPISSRVEQCTTVQSQAPQLDVGLLRRKSASRRATSHTGSLYALPWSVVASRYLRLDQQIDRKSTRLNSSHSQISYAVFCLKKKKQE